MTTKRKPKLIAIEKPYTHGGELQRVDVPTEEAKVLSFQPGVNGLHEQLPSDSPHGYPTLWLEDSIEAVIANGFGIGMIQADAEALEFARFVEEQKPRVIVVLGTLCGGMDYVMNRMAKPELQISVDAPWNERDPHIKWPSDLLRSALPDLVWVTGNIHHAASFEAVKAALNGKPVDLLFIDADHSESGSLQHWQMYGPLVRAGGHVAFHDCRNGWGCGLTFDRLAQSHESRVFVAAEGAIFGIGVIRV